VTSATSAAQPDPWQRCPVMRIFDLGEISDLLLFLSYFSSQSNGIKFGDYFFDVSCAN